MNAASAGAPALPPWLVGHWQRLWRAERRGRLGHAWLLTGPVGLGKRLFADWLAAALLCRNPGPDGAPCGLCAECQLLASGNHPDLLRVVPDPESKSGDITIDQMRDLHALETLTCHRGRRKVIEIVPAEAMNRSAANSLLKMLEEPTEGTLLVLIGDDATRLPATIRSRCQHLSLVPPPSEQALPWLEQRLPAPPAPITRLLRLAGGAPLRALEIADPGYLGVRDQAFAQFLSLARGGADPLAVALTWQALDVPMLLETVLGWVCDIARLACDPRAPWLADPDLREPLAALVAQLPPERLHDYMRELMRARALAQSPVNKQLLLESVLIRWVLVTGAGAPSGVA